MKTRVVVVVVMKRRKKIGERMNKRRRKGGREGKTEEVPGFGIEHGGRGGCEALASLGEQKLTEALSFFTPRCQHLQRLNRMEIKRLWGVEEEKV